MRRLDDTTILFDWNGTIVLDAERARRALNGVLTARSLPQLDTRQFGERFQLPMRALFLSLGIAETELGGAETEWNRGMVGGDPAGRAGLVGSLIELHQRGARLGVISAASGASITADHRRLGLPDVWDCVVGSVADKVVALRQRRGGRARAIYVGDTVYDMVSAKAAGYCPVGVAGGYTSAALLHAAGARTVISDLGELDAYVDGDSPTVRA